MPSNEPASLKTFQRLDEHLLRDAADPPSKRSGADRTLTKGVNNQQSPFFREQRQNDACRTVRPHDVARDIPKSDR